MPKEEWGTKRLCPHCATRFYDLKADPMTCPACGNTFTVTSLTDGRGKTLVTENTAILPYLADLRPGTSLFAAAGTTERALIQSWIGYLGTEVHVGAFRPINRPERYSTDEAAFPGIRQRGLQQLANALKPLD